MKGFLYIRKSNIPLKLYLMLACVLGTALLTVGGNAQTTKQSSSTGTERKLVCRSVPRTGSHFKTRICKYETTWKDIDETEREGAQDFMRRAEDRAALTSGTPSGGGSPYDRPVTSVNNPNSP